MKKYLIGIPLLIILLLIAAVVVLPSIINWNKYKPRISEVVQEATGRDLRIMGDIRLSLVPKIRFNVSDVYLSNAAGMSSPEMMSVGKISAIVRLFPLIFGKVAIDTLVIHKPALFLEINKEGYPNWEFTKTEGAAQSDKTPEKKSRSFPITDARLGDVRMEQGLVFFKDSRTGQEVAAKKLNVNFGLSGFNSPLQVNAAFVLNDEPVTMDVFIKTPEDILTGKGFKVDANLKSKFMESRFAAGIQQHPVPGIDGVFNLNIGSMGNLAAWLKAPLNPSQRDPGPLKIKVILASDGNRVVLKQASIDGVALKARANGSFDGSGDIKKVVLNVESTVLDFDRYLPPIPIKGKRKDMASVRDKKQISNPLAAISDKPFDLTPLQKTEAKISINIDGLKGMGYKIGAIDFKAGLNKGVLEADLNKLQLYGGNITGNIKLDGDGNQLGVESLIKVDKVNVGRLAKAATKGEAPITGIASGSLKAIAHGNSPQAIAKSLSGRLLLNLGEVNVKNAQRGAISEINIDLNMPDVKTSPTLKGTLVYNRERINFDVTVDPLEKVITAERFTVKTSLNSRLIKTGYKGKVQRLPVPGLDGTFDLNIPSVGKLAAWVGHPLERSQPDPGSLKVRARFSSDKAKIKLKEAVIESKGLKAKANGSFDGSGDIKQVVLNVESTVLDFDRYLPPVPMKGKRKDMASVRDKKQSSNPLAAISDKPFDLTPLQKTDAKISINIDGLKGMGYNIGAIDFKAGLNKGVLEADLKKLQLYGGNITGNIKLDGSGDEASIATLLNIEKVRVNKLAQAATGEEPPVSGIASGKLDVKMRGSSPRTLVESLNGKLKLNLDGITAKDKYIAKISKVNIDFDIPGNKNQSHLKGAVVYNKKPINFDLITDPLQQILSEKPFNAKVALASEMLKANYDGSVQYQSVPGLDGKFNLEIPSVGKLAAWLDRPLASSQPDPGPLKLRANFTGNGKKALLKEAVVEGKAFKAKANGSFDFSGKIHNIVAKVIVDQLDANAYLPPEQIKDHKTSVKKGAPTQKKPSGWSEKPFALEPFKKTNADIDIQTGQVKYKDLSVKRSQISAKLLNGILKADVQDVQISNGTVRAALTLDASGKKAALNYEAFISGVESKPILDILLDKNRLSGKLEFKTKGTARGISQKEIVKTLNGNGQFKFVDGAIEGIDIAGTLRQVKTLGFGDDKRQKTDFAELSGSFVITNGVLKNQDLKMLAPFVRLSGQGKVPMPPRTVDYLATAKLVATVKGQGGNEALSGLPIGIFIKGPWDKPSYTVDWKSVFAKALKDPKRLSNMPANMLEAAKGFGVTLPVAGKGSTTKKGVGGILQSVPGLLKGKQSTTTQEDSSTQTREQQKKKKTKPLDVLKGILGK